MNHPISLLPAVSLIVLLSLQGHGSAASPCPPEAGRAVSEGWTLYRAGGIGESLQLFDTHS